MMWFLCIAFVSKQSNPFPFHLQEFIETINIFKKIKAIWYQAFLVQWKEEKKTVKYFNFVVVKSAILCWYHIIHIKNMRSSRNDSSDICISYSHMCFFVLQAIWVYSLASRTLLNYNFANKLFLCRCFTSYKSIE